MAALRAGSSVVSWTHDNQENDLVPHPYKGAKGLARIRGAIAYSVSGVIAALRHEAAFRQEAMAAIVLVPIALFLHVTWVAKAMMVASVFLVLIIELVNSAIEAVVDRISLESHPLAKRAKDIGSAAVFLSLLNWALVWALVLLPLM